MPTVNERLVDATYLYFTYLMQYAKGAGQEVRRMMDRLGGDLASQLALASKADGSGIDTGRIRELLAQVNRVIENGIGELSGKFGVELPAISRLTSDYFVKSMNAILDVRMFTSGYNLMAGLSEVSVFGKPLGDWWSKQSQELRDAFETQMRIGAVRGESVQQLMARIFGGTVQNGVKVPGIMEGATRRAQALVRTGILSLSNGAREAVIKDNADIVKGVQWVATLDKGTCPICGALDGKAWSLDDLTQTLDGEAIEMPGMPPVHPNCRCTVIPVLRSFREMGIDADEIPPGTRASMDGQIPATVSYEQWFASKDLEFPGFAEAVLGKANAALWKAGGQQGLLKLLDQTSKPLTIEKLGTALENAVENLASTSPIRPSTGNLPAITQAARETREHLPSADNAGIEAIVRGDFAKRGIDLTEQEVRGVRAALRGYSGSFYSYIREFQEKGFVEGGSASVNEVVGGMARDLNRWIDNAPRWPSEKPIYRGMLGERPYAIFDLVPVGGKVEIEGLTSFTSDIDVADKFAGIAHGGLMRNVVIEVVGGDYVGTSMTFASAFPDEKEVLVRGGQYLRILSKRVDGNRLWVKARIEGGRT